MGQSQDELQAYLFLFKFLYLICCCSPCFGTFYFIQSTAIQLQTQYKSKVRS